MSSNPGQGELEVRSTSFLSRTWTKNILQYSFWRHYVVYTGAYINSVSTQKQL